MSWSKWHSCISASKYTAFYNWLTKLVKIHIQHCLVCCLTYAVLNSMLFLFFLSMLTLSFCISQILHHHIAAVEKLPLTTSGCPLVIQCKNFRIVHFVVPRERDCHDIYNSLLQLSRTGKTCSCKRLCSICMDNKLGGVCVCVNHVCFIYFSLSTCYVKYQMSLIYK